MTGFGSENGNEKEWGVEFQFLDQEFNPTGEVFLLKIKDNNEVDLTDFPDELVAETWMRMGLPDVYRNGRIYPKDGKRFLAALLRTRNQTWKVIKKFL